jgi:hypothetical protein
VPSPEELPTKAKNSMLTFSDNFIAPIKQLRVIKKKKVRT